MNKQVRNKIFYIMGVSGCGKSTIGKLLAKQLSLPFFDGDDYHPEANIRKMESGQPLDDADRQGWLENLNSLAKTQLERGSGAVIACSALKRAYRAVLRGGISGQTVFIYLEGNFEQISDRLSRRSGHFMPAGLLKSQFDALEEPEDAVRISVEDGPVTIVEEILKMLG